MNDIELSESASMFAMLDNLDNKQIASLEMYGETDQPLAYEIMGRKSTSVLGAKHLVLFLADSKLHGNNAMPLRVVVGGTKFDSKGQGEDERWYCTVIYENSRLGVSFEGHGQCAQYLTKKDKSKIYDVHARTKAHSKAKRNAIDEHVPEKLKEMFFEYAKKLGRIHTLKFSSTTSYENQPNEKAETPAPQNFSKIDFCKCEKSMPKFDKDHTCVTCNKPVDPKKCPICLGKK